MPTRKEVKDTLNRIGCNAAFSLRTVSFMDLARDSAQFCIFKDHVETDTENIRTELKAIGVIPEFKQRWRIVE